MLRDENIAFSEEEVGGACAQPCSLLTAVNTINTANSINAAQTASPPSPTATGVPASCKATYSHSQREDQRAGNTTTQRSTPQHHNPNTSSSSKEMGRESAFAVAAGVTDATGTSTRPSPLNTNTATTTAEDKGLSSEISRVSQTSEQQRQQQQVHRNPRLSHAHSVVAAAAAASAAAAQREAAMAEELKDSDNGLVVRTPLSPTHSRSTRHSRGPPAAAVMTDPPVYPIASATTLMSAPTAAEGEANAVRARTSAIPRRHSRESITFSIHSSNSSEASETHDDNDDEGRASPVYLANERARRDAQGGSRSAAAAGLVTTITTTGGSSDSPLQDTYTRAAGFDDGAAEADLFDRTNPHAAESLQSSPASITLWGVHRDLRRKRIKKVSHYILGSLLGEGSYGVVRDAIDINTDNVNRRFQRCAIKIVSGNYAKADMPAIFEKRNRSNSGSSREGGAGDAPALSQGTLRRTAGNGGAAVVSVVGSAGGGMRYHREEEQRRQEGFQREMRNLQRFHCKNIIRALDSFTRYSKEYVVLPIAICSVQQLVRQLMRTRWREAVREWRRRQRVLLRRRGGNGTVPRGLPMVPSSLSTLDLDDLTFMEEDEFDLDEDFSNDDDMTDATEGEEGNTPYDAQHRRKDDVHVRERSSASLSDREENSYEDERRQAAATRLSSSQKKQSGNPTATTPSRQRVLPRVPSSNSNTTTTTTTARTIDSYDNGNSIDARRGNPQQQQHVHEPQPGGENETSDLSSGGVHHGASPNRVRVMSATPITLDEPVLLKENASAAGVTGWNGGSRHTRSGAATATITSTATTSPLHDPVNKGDVSETAGVSLCGHAVNDSRPHLSFPMCSTTLLKGIFYQVISGVEYLHQQNLAHNDIKPSNVLLFEDGTVKLGDLGSVSETFNDQGTPLCASPELCRYFYGAMTPPSSFSQSTEAVGRDAAKPSDMWCCGLLLYYLITGKPGPLPVQIRYFQSLHSKQYTQARPRRQSRRGSGSGDGGARGPTPSFDDGPTASVPPSIRPPPVVTRYQLYREIAAQTAPVDLSDLPDMIPPDLGDDAGDDTTVFGAAPAAATAAAAQYPRGSVRHLLAGLLEVDPLRRLTAQQALRHPWLRMAFRVKGSEREESNGGSHRGRKSSSTVNLCATGEDATRGGNGPRKTPSKQAMEEAIQRDVARRVTESRHVRRMLQQDRQRHLQFVADCCNMLNLNIPPEIIRVQPAEPYRDELPGGSPNRGNSTQGLLSAARAATPQQRKAAAAALAAAIVGGGRNTTRANHITKAQRHFGGAQAGGSDAVTGSVQPGAMVPEVLPPGCVDTELFLPHTEEDYYELKSGKSEFDVRVLRRKPLIMAQFDEYFHNVVLVQCGYRTGPDPNYQAMRVRAVPLEDELGSGSGRRRNGSGGGSGGGGSGSGGGTQQPSVVILPGASSNAYRRSPTIGLPQLEVAAVEGSAGVDVSECVTPADVAAAMAEDVWGAGPRHMPRAHLDANGSLVPPPTAHSGGVPERSSGSPATKSGSANNRLTTPAHPIFTDPSTPTSTRGNNNNSSSSAVNPRAPGGTRASAAHVNGGHSRSSIDAMDAQEPMGTAVVNGARASGTQVGTRRSGAGVAHGGRAAAAAGRSPRQGSDSASEAEQNVAMRESSKCLCGLM